MKIIAVTDRKQCIRSFEEQIKMIVSAGADMIVLREKDLSKDEYRVLASKVMGLCKDSDTVFCINTFTDIALELGAECVWIPYHDFLKNGRPSIRRVGVSVHSETEAYDVAERGADFIVYGNVFETTCKPRKAGKGLDELGKICSNTNIWVFAIGGINENNLGEIYNSKADGVCIMSGFMKSEDPSVLVKKAKSLSV